MHLSLTHPDSRHLTDYYSKIEMIPLREYIGIVYTEAAYYHTISYDDDSTEEVNLIRTRVLLKHKRITKLVLTYINIQCTTLRVIKIFRCPKFTLY